MAMDPKLYQALFETFKGELSEQHQVMIDGLIQLEKSTTEKDLEAHLEKLFRISHNLKGAAKSVLVDEVANIAHQLEDIFSSLRIQKKAPDKTVVDQCMTLADSMLDALNAAESNMQASTFSSDTVIQIPLRRVDRVNAKINELAIFQLRLSQSIKDAQAFMQLLRQINAQESNSLQKHFSEIISHLEELSSEFYRDLSVLQKEGWSMSLLTIAHLMSPLKRTVREIAEHLGKEVDLIIIGEAIEVDKSILDSLKAPLQHLVRNAIGHGIETPAERKKLGKSPKATLTIRAESESSQICLTVSDDGRGINTKKLKAKALEQQLLPKNVLNAMSDRELVSLVFYSGLSTSESVSELSGRGVGLDAVLADIKRVQGNISVDSEAGKGTTFTLTLPLKLSSSRGLFVRVINNNFMLPTVSLNKLLHVKANHLERVDNCWVTRVQDRPVSVFILAHLLGMADTLDTSKNYDGILISIDARGDMNEMILLVDEIIGEHDCVIKPLPMPVDSLPYLAGATLNEVGHLTLVLNTKYLTEKAGTEGGVIHDSRQTSEKISEKNIAPPIQQLRNILVVDDAITTRSLSVSALQAAGYNTIEAINGEQAWEVLQDTPIDCVVTDIEMPKMTGFELIEVIKKHEHFAKLPVIIVSCLNRPKDKARGLALGVNAYLVKNDFDTRVLIDTLETLL